MKTRAKVLVAEGCPSTRSRLCDALCGAGLLPLQAGEASEVLRRAREEAPDLVLLDLGLDAGGDLVRVLKASRDADEFLPLVCLSRGSDERLGALRRGADECLERGVDDELLIARLESLLRIKRSHDRLLARERELERLSVTDPLTGLYNRRLFEERLREEFVRSQRFGDPLSLIMVDLDHFKRVNDRHGHLAGDEVLRGAAAILRNCVREIDIVTRYGGEEFALLLIEASAKEAAVISNRLRERIAGRAVGYSDAAGVTIEIPVTVSIGVADLREGDSAQSLLERADSALYAAKAGGRNLVKVAGNG
ncbi:MAG TPA: diguanylate cyclase response regulator [Myxococcales bacterium]|nr:diguanylate cyclase response regulator [Myxococcales bacterium]